jgi:indole-3-glycerol phosphate synthase
MSVLFEVQNEHELEKALTIDAPIIGINNRDLTTLKINLETTLRLRSLLPAHKVAVSESGIKTREDVLRLQSAGINAMLVGTILMKSKDIGVKIRDMLGTV